jgi:DNA-binding NtrC family response regulator
MRLCPRLRALYLYGVRPWETVDLVNLDEPMIARNSIMDAAVERLVQLAAEGQRAFVYGESGVGVGWLCRWTHHHSSNSDGPFVEMHAHRADIEVECEAGIRAASGGTLMVRCFHELPHSLQVRLVACPSDFRLVATLYSNGGRAPQRCLDPKMLEAFPAPVEIPPLRARREDITELTTRFANWVCEENGWTLQPFNADELRRLHDFEWPGNVRELRNAVLVRAHALHSGRAWDEFAYMDSMSSRAVRR